MPGMSYDAALSLLGKHVCIRQLEPSDSDLPFDFAWVTSDRSSRLFAAVSGNGIIGLATFDRTKFQFRRDNLFHHQVMQKVEYRRRISEFLGKD